MAEQHHIGWFRECLRASRSVEPDDPAELLAWLRARRRDVPFSAELIMSRDVSGWRQTDGGNFEHESGRFFRIEGDRVTSAPGVRETAGWDQPILTQAEGGVLALLCRQGARGIEFLLQAKADPGNVGYLQFCHTIQSTREMLRDARIAFAEYFDPSGRARVVYRAKHNEEGSRFWRKSNEDSSIASAPVSSMNRIMFTFRWACLSQIKWMMLMDDIVGPYVRTVLAPL